MNAKHWKGRRTMQALSKPTREDYLMFAEWSDHMKDEPPLQYVNEANTQPVPPALLKLLDDEPNECLFYAREEQEEAEEDEEQAVNLAANFYLWLIGAALVFACGLYLWIEAHK